MTDRRGFTLIELLVVVLIISIVAAIAQPQLTQVIVRARAADVVSQMQAVRLAVHTYQTDQHVWPEQAGDGGGVPPELVPYLPENFSFSGEDYDLIYENWGGSPYDVAVLVDTDDTTLGLTALEMFSSPKWSAGSTYTWVIE